MSLVSVRINGRDYNLACDDGQEEQLVMLAQEVDDRVRQIARQAPHAGEIVLLLLTAVMLADEQTDLRRQLRQSQAKLARLEERIENGEFMAPGETRNSGAAEDAVADMLKDVAGRIEKIAEQLEMS